MDHYVEAEAVYAFGKSKLAEVNTCIQTATHIKYKFPNGKLRELINLRKSLSEAIHELETSMHIYKLPDMNGEFEDDATSVLISSKNEVQATIYDIDDILTTLHPGNARH